MKPRIAIILSFFLLLTAAYGQSDNMVHVKSFPGNDVGTKVTNAMATCPAQGPCILVIDASLAGFASGTMPTLCANCSLADYRSGSTGLAGVSSDGASGLRITGAVNAGAVNGMIEASACGGSSPPSWCSGSDIGAWATAAFSSSLCSNGCAVHIKAGSYTQTSTITMRAYGETLTGDGAEATKLTCSAADCVDLYPTYGGSEGAGGGVERLQITGSGATNIIHARDIIGESLRDLQLDGASGACLEIEDYSYWSERNVVDHVNFGYACTTSLLLAVNAAETIAPASFQYNHFRSLGFNPTGNQKAVALTGYATMGNGDFQAEMNFSGSSGAGSPIGFYLSSGTDAGGTGSFTSATESWDVKFEANQALVGGTYYAYLWDLSSAGNTVTGCGLVTGDPIPSTLISGSSLGVSACAMFWGTDYTYGTPAALNGYATDFHAAQAYLIPSQSPNGYYNGIGLNCRYSITGSSFQCLGAGSSNGGAMILEQQSTGDTSFYFFPSTGGSTQNVALSAPYLHAILESDGFHFLGTAANNREAAIFADDTGTVQGTLLAGDSTDSVWPHSSLGLEGSNSGGLWLDAYAGPVQLQTGRNTRFTCDTSGNCGIGNTTTVTSDPTYWDSNGVKHENGAAPIISGTGASLSHGTNAGGLVTLSSATSATITFANGGYASWAACTGNLSVAASTATTYVSAQSKTACTFTFSASVSGTLNFHVTGQ